MFRMTRYSAAVRTQAAELVALLVSDPIGLTDFRLQTPLPEAVLAINYAQSVFFIGKHEPNLKRAYRSCSR